jgi:hypothetical protein
MLATSSHDGATQALLSAHGRDASLIASPANEELVTLAAEMPVGGKLIAVAKARTTHSPLCSLQFGKAPLPGAEIPCMRPLRLLAHIRRIGLGHP